ncbi:hypothetical protein LTR78_005164 [Recurvomyces mirabilis]|uniref:Acetyl-CoA synthetase-like protein n=1 Tax=Recurvomyces mirabilis TaxID=574656 RepID=A0AAE1C1Q8_9PEZI|nr:hypothetical protein LTR78_005164 [Recurvomyces mirabilis]KAK5157714.1 hypothetical protein LTS14_003636 [Recurvomyces mirabilis]
MTDDVDNRPTINDISDTIEELLDNEVKVIERSSGQWEDGARHMKATLKAPQSGLTSKMSTPSKPASNHDRTTNIPSHTGRNIFPNHGLFSRLLRFAYVQPPRLCIRDVTTGQEATHHQLLSDVLHLRQRLYSQLGPSTLSTLERQDGAIYIAVLAPGGYEYTVAMLAVLALGAAVVPLSVALPVSEAKYFITTSHSVAVLTATSTLQLGLSLEKEIKDSDPTSTFTCLPIAPSTSAPLLPRAEVKISSNPPLSDAAPGVVIFTSGTTGPPKGAVMRRSYTFTDALGIADHYAVTPSDVLLHVLPVHHATGLGIMFFPFLVAGATIEFKSSGFSEAWTWERWRRSHTSKSAADRLTFFSGVPTIYMRMRRYFESTISPQTPAEKSEYIAGARTLRACLCGTSALPKPIADFWTEILGKKILLRYGATEIGAVFRMPYHSYRDPSADDMKEEEVPDGSVGILTPGVDVQLSTSPSSEGEILVRSAEMFSHYLHSPSATQAAHNTEGYYRTGDIARQEGDWYWILGRASVDIIKSGGYKISALDIEREILGLDYIAEVMVVGVPDEEEFGERVGAVVVMKYPLGATGMKHHLTIEKLRRDLRGRVAGYKLPTLLRVSMAELPKSGTGKVVKKVLGPEFFPRDWRTRGVGKVQVWDPKDREGDGGKGQPKL